MCHDSTEEKLSGVMTGNVMMSEREAASQSVYVLAFLGDGVYSVLVREKIVLGNDGKAGDMHKLCVGAVNAAAQAAGYRKIRDFLTEDEAAVYRRARNARSTHTPKNMSEGEYHSATGVEALFGYLYLCGKHERMYELLSMILSDSVHSLQQDIS